MITIRLPYLTPPLRSNDRLNRYAKSRVVKAIREATAWQGRQVWSHSWTFPIIEPVIITFVWEVTDNRVRDVGASTPTLKAAIDGLVDAGILLHDRHSIVTEERYRIEVGGSKGIRLEIRALDDEPPPQMRVAGPQEGRQGTDGPERHRSETEPFQSATLPHTAKVKKGS